MMLAQSSLLKAIGTALRLFSTHHAVYNAVSPVHRTENRFEDHSEALHSAGDGETEAWTSTMNAAQVWALSRDKDSLHDS